VPPSFDPPRPFTGAFEDYLVLAVMLLAAVLGQLFIVLRGRHAENVHSPPLAWLRATLYFSVVLVISWATGVLHVLVRSPLVGPGNVGEPAWRWLTGLWLIALAWGYLYWWPRGTLTHGRRLYPLTQFAFGLAWGFSSGQLTLILWALIEDFGFARWLTAVSVFLLLSVYGQIYQSGWWDIHVSPPHNVRATNAGKVLFAHMPFLVIALTHFALFGDALLFVAFHALALAFSTVAMRFPPFWEKDGPPVSREIAIGS
jgi:hypothetical protein